MSNTPNAGIPYVPEGTLDPAAGLNDALDTIDALIQTAVIDMTTTAAPTSSDGDRYIVGAGATGAWAGQDGNLARYVAEGDFWQFFEAGTQVRLVLNLADNVLYAYNDSVSPAVWQGVAGAGASGADLGFFFPGTASSNQLLSKYVAARDMEIPANMAGAVGHIGTNPTATWTAIVSVNGSQVGTIQVSTGGVFTFATTSGLAVPIDAGDRIEFAAPSSADGTAADIAVTLTVTL